MKQIHTLAVAAWIAAAPAGFAGPSDSASSQADHIYNGRYQALVADCSGCHTRPGGAYMAGGAPIETPFGALVPPNITPDAETGMGAWTLQEFRDAMTKGIGKGGRHLYPAMPYVYYSKMPTADIDDIYSYLKTVAPAHNKVVANQLPFPFSIRASMIGWNLVNFSPEPFKPDPGKSPDWNRGAYLVQGPGHCAACHSPKTWLGADKAGNYMQGANLQGWFAPNITGNPWIGIGSWTEAEVVAYLKTGTNGRAVASGPMAEAIEASTSQMTEADLGAIAVYLKSLTSPGEAPQPVDPKGARMMAGAAIFRDNCSACHGTEGMGAKYLFPALKGNPEVQQADATSMARVVILGDKGVQTAGAVTRPAMPALGWRLTDAQIAEVLTYIGNSWGNAAAPVTDSDVHVVRQQLQ